METEMGKCVVIQVRQANIVTGSAPIWLRKWVKVKYIPNEEELAEQNNEEQGDKDKGALELAHAIMGQMNSNS